MIVENNIVNHITPYGTPGELIETVRGWKKLTGGWALSGGSSVTFRNNTAASLWHRGFSIPAHKCGASNSKIKDNIAHSISGFGVIVTKDNSRCNEFSDFSAYKIGIAAVEMTVSGDNHVTNVVTIDSARGIHMMGSPGKNIEVRDNFLYGSQNMKNSDCPLSSDGMCGCTGRTGITIPTFAGPTKDGIHKDFMMHEYFEGGGHWVAGDSLYIDNTFIGFDSKINACGGEQRVIATNKSHPQYHPIAHFRRNKFVNQGEDAMFKMYAPNPLWAKIPMCGTFTCTGLYNAVIKMSESRFSGFPYVGNIPYTF